MSLLNRSITLLCLFLLATGMTRCTSNNTDRGENSIPESSSEWVWATQPPAEGTSIIEPRYAETAVGPDGNIYFLTTLTKSQGKESINRLHLSCYNPSGRQLWAQEYPGQVVAHCLSIDSDGNLWTAGTFKDRFKLGDQELNSGERPTWFVAKFRKLNGKCMMAKAGDKHCNYVFGRLGSDNHFWVAGNWGNQFASGWDEIMNGKQTQGFLRCLDDQGNTIWSNKVGTSDFARIKQMRPLKDGSMLIGGVFESDLQMGGQELALAGYMGQEGFLASILPNGKAQWLRQMGSLDSESYTIQVTDGIIDILPDGEGGLFISGKLHDRMAFGSDTLELAPYGEDCYLAYQDSQGEFLWARRISGTHGGGNALAMGPDHSIWVSGFYEDSLWLGDLQLIDSLRDDNCYLAEFDLQGNYLRHTSIHGKTAMGYFNIRNLTHTGELVLASGHKPRSAQFGDITLERDCRYYNAFLAAFRTD